MAQPNTKYAQGAMPQAPKESRGNRNGNPNITLVKDTTVLNNNFKKVYPGFKGAIPRKTI